MITDYRKKENDYEVIFNKEFPNRVSNALKDFLITCKQEDKEVEDIIKKHCVDENGNFKNLYDILQELNECYLNEEREGQK